MVHTISSGGAMKDELSMEDSIITSLRRIIRAVDLHSKYLAQRYGLTEPQFVLLKELARNQPLSTGELAQKVSLGQATVSQVLDRLGKRSRDPRKPGTDSDLRGLDARSNNLSLDPTLNGLEWTLFA